MSEKKETGIKMPDYNALIDSVEKEFDMPSVTLKANGLGEFAPSTCSLTLDLILGGGFAPGRFSVIFGPEQSGKSTIIYNSLKLALENNKICLLGDYEGTIDPSYCKRMGVNTDKMFGIIGKKGDILKQKLLRLYNPDSGEQWFAALFRILDKLPDRKEEDGVPLIFFIDSLASMPSHTRTDATKAEDLMKSNMSLLARMFSDSFNLIKSKLKQKNVCLIAANQMRINPMAYGNKEYEVGGNAIAYYSDVRLKTQRMSKSAIMKIPLVKKLNSGNTDATGAFVEDHYSGKGSERFNYSIVKTIKNKVYSPYRESHIRFCFEEQGRPGYGLDPNWDAIQFLYETGQIEFHKKGVFTIKIADPEWKGQLKEAGWVDFKKFMVENKNNPETDIYGFCKKQLLNNTAFELYHNNLQNIYDESEDSEDSTTEE